MIDFLLALLSLLLLLIALVRQPSIANAPPGWHVHGVRTDGSYEFMRAPTEQQPGKGPGCPTNNACVSNEPLRRVHSRVYCTGASVPIAVNYRVVGCQARH